MARVVLAATVSGTRDGKDWPVRGSEVDLPDDEAAGLVKSGTALWPDDERVARVRGHIFGDAELAGAPTGRDITEGQPDTHLARARALTQKHGGDVEAIRSATREAAERADYTDEQTLPQATGGPKVGDDNPAPVDAPTPVDTANVVEATRDGDDGASGLVEAADATSTGEERAVRRSEPRKR